MVPTYVDNVVDLPYESSFFVIIREIEEFIVHEHSL